MNGRAPSTSSFNYQWTYDVFINFRGEDTRHGFTGNLYKALCQKGILTFIDDEELNKGEEITPTLLRKIEQSRMAIVVFSKNYASSTFCLDELVKILQCIKRKGRLVWPIFYDVEPSDVRHQKGNYGEALAIHKKNFKANDEKVQNWKQALCEAANISGLHYNLRHEYEYIFIEKIVKEISRKMKWTPLHIASHPVGLEPRVLKIISLLENGSTDMVGICGIGGIGKTTIARAVYNSIADQFESKSLCFLHDIKENSRKFGLQQIQERMLSKILSVDIKVEDVNEGVPIIKKRFNQKKILLILDNVDKLEQLEKLAGSYDWFGSGSKIIITTRDRHLLLRHGVESIYEVEELNDKESLELLSWNAFKRNSIIDPSYMEIMNCVVQYVQGLPLALEVIGSHLFGRTVNEWHCAIDGYRKIPSKDIHQILKVSYDGLEENEQEIFLDIASFFKGEQVTYVMNMVKYAHGLDPDYGIRLLIDKGLIKIEGNCIKMHDLIQDMGREIVRQESPREAGKRTRLWSSEDIVHVLENNTGTDNIKVIIQKYLSEDIEVNWDGNAFKKMKNLKILILRKTCFSKGPKYLPYNLRVLQWWGYPASCLPIDFHPKKLVMFDLQDSFLQSLEPLKKMESLSVVNLSRSQFITQIPDVSSIPNLTKLNLGSCENLIEVHESVGYLKKLRILDVQWCVKLRTFPCRIKLPSLEYLGLQHCSSLKKFPEILEKMEYITSLDLSDTNLELPTSICNLVRLHALIAEKCSGLLLPSSIAMLPTLTDVHIDRCSGELQLSKQFEDEEELNSAISSSALMRKLFLQNSNISDDFLSKCLAWFVNVRYIFLSRNNFTILPACVKECRLLEWLYLEECINLREIRGIPPNIKELLATNCTSLSSESRSILMSQELDEAGDKLICVPGSTLPEWVDYRNKGVSTSFWFHEKFPVISLCCVIGNKYHVNHRLSNTLHATVIINGEKIEVFNRINKWVVTNCSLSEDHILVLDVSERIIFRHYGIKEASLATEWNHQVVLSDKWNHVEVSIDLDVYGSHLVKEVGIIVRKQEKGMEDIRFTNPHKRTKLLHDFYLGSSFIASTWTSGTARDEEEGRLLAEMGESAHLTTHGKDKKQTKRKWKRKAPIQDDVTKEFNKRCLCNKQEEHMKKDCNKFKAWLDKKDAKSQEGIHVPDPSLEFMSKGDEQFAQKSELKLEIAKVAYEGKLVDVEGAERFFQLMQRLSHNRAFDLSGRIMLLNVMANTEWGFCTYYSVLMKGLPLLDKWIHDVLEGEFDDIASDKSIKEFLSASLLTLNDLPVSPYYIQSCGILNSLERLRKHFYGSHEIQYRANNLIKKWNQIFQSHIKGLEESFGNIHFYGTGNNSHTTLSVEDVALQEQEYSEGPDSSDSIDTESYLSDTSVDDVELQLKRKGKMKVDDNLPSTSSTSGSTMYFGERVSDSSNSHVQQAEAETHHTHFPKRRVTCQKDKLTLKDKSLSWDGMEGEDQVLCLKNKPILNDQCTMRERDKDGIGSESSKQRRHSRPRGLRALFSSVMSLCSSS